MSIGIITVSDYVYIYFSFSIGTFNNCLNFLPPTFAAVTAVDENVKPFTGFILFDRLLVAYKIYGFPVPVSLITRRN